MNRRQMLVDELVTVTIESRPVVKFDPDDSDETASRRSEPTRRAAMVNGVWEIVY